MDEEFNKKYKRLKIKLKKFADDYSIDDLKINDLDSLRAMIQAHIALEDLEQATFKIRGDGLDLDNIMKLDKINKIMSDLRGDINRISDQLKISRKVRKSDQETSVISYIESLKEKAKKFHEAKEKYILCPSCQMLLATVWTLYPNANNKIRLTCQRTLENGDKCRTVVDVTTKLLDEQLSNKRIALPESIL